MKYILATMCFCVGFALGINQTETIEVETVKYIKVIEHKTEPTEPLEETESLGDFIITAYCPCEKCCDEYADGITSTGAIATPGRTIAVDPSVIPYGSEVMIDGHIYIAEDCGGAIKGNRIDIYFDTHEEALEFGRQQSEVFIMKGR